MKQNLTENFEKFRSLICAMIFIKEQFIFLEKFFELEFFEDTVYLKTGQNDENCVNNS